MTPIAKGDPVELRELLAKAAPGILSADTHHAKDHAGRTHGFIRSEGELVPLGAIVLGVEGMPQDQGRARLALIVAAVNKLPALLDRIEALEAENKRLRDGLGEGFAERLAEEVREAGLSDAGRWVTCSGCHESEHGHDIGHYPFATAFNCKLGAGCHECGGIGAIWDTTDYGAWAEDMLGDESALTDGEP